MGGVGTITQDMLDYISYTGNARGYNEHESVRFVITGDLVKIPFGDRVGIAFGYEYREEFGGHLPDPLEVAGETTDNKSDPIKGGFYINELFGELLIPLLTDQPGAERVELIGAIRLADYNRLDAAMSYKGGIRCQIIPDLTLRGTYSTAFRAPPLFASFSERVFSTPNLLDLCSSDNPTYLSNPTVRARCARPILLLPHGPSPIRSQRILLV